MRLILCRKRTTRKPKPNQILRIHPLLIDPPTNSPTKLRNRPTDRPTVDGETDQINQPTTSTRQQKNSPINVETNRPTNPAYQRTNPTNLSGGGGVTSGAVRGGGASAVPVRVDLHPAEKTRKQCGTPLRASSRAGLSFFFVCACFMCVCFPEASLSRIVQTVL